MFEHGRRRRAGDYHSHMADKMREMLDRERDAMFGSETEYEHTYAKPSSEEEANFSKTMNRDIVMICGKCHKEMIYSFLWKRFSCNSPHCKYAVTLAALHSARTVN